MCSMGPQCNFASHLDENRIFSVDELTPENRKNWAAGDGGSCLGWGFHL